MVAITWAWYNDSYIKAAKPIKSLELHYTMIQFLILNYLLLGENYLTSQLIVISFFVGSNKLLLLGIAEL